MSEKHARGQVPVPVLEDGSLSQRQVRPETLGVWLVTEGWKKTSSGCRKHAGKHSGWLPVSSCSGQCYGSGSLWRPPRLCRTGHTAYNKSQSWEPRTPLLGKGGEWTGSVRKVVGGARDPASFTVDSGGEQLLQASPHYPHLQHGQREKTAPTPFMGGCECQGVPRQQGGCSAIIH